MANVRGEALRLLHEATQKSVEPDKATLTIDSMREQAAANCATVRALWAVFEFVDAAELEGV